MSRPQKNNVKYYPMDVGFLNNKKIKLLKSEFGLNCIVVIISVFENIYGREGYFLKWDNDECLLMSDGVGGGCTPNYVREVLNGCIRRSLFDEGVFNMFGVITSEGIQRRYIRMFESRKEIKMASEYFLLDVTNSDDVPEWLANKLVIEPIFEEKPDKKAENLNKKVENPDKKVDNSQIKLKEIKIKKRKENKAESELSPVDMFFESVWKLYPNKQGKNGVTKKAKGELSKHEYDTVAKCIETYVTSKPEWKSYMDGSTFFNGRWKEFLDAGNEQPITEQPQKYKVRELLD